MNRRLFVGLLPPALLAALVLAAGCKSAARTRPYHEPPPPDLQPTTIAYVDTDAFDALFETALTNQDPVIVVHTDRDRPDWGPRLNAWIAAWNRGGKVGAPAGAVRMQAPFGPALAGEADSIREFRLLVDDLMTRVEEVAGKGSAWWAEERTRAHRIGLLKPYNLHFHLDEEQHIQLIFFNGNYAPYYPSFMRLLTAADGQDPAAWARGLECSRCRHAAGPARPGDPLAHLAAGE